MNRTQKIVCLLFFISSVACAEEKPVTLERVKVTEAPFGQLGLDFHARVPWLALVDRSQKIIDMTVKKVVAGSPAEKSGFRAKDQVVKIDGVSVRDLSIRDLDQIWFEKEAGQLVKFEIRRSGMMELTVIEVPVEKKKKPNQSVQPTGPSGRGSS